MRFRNIVLLFLGISSGILLGEIIARVAIPANRLLFYNPDLFAVKDHSSIFHNVKGEQNYSQKLDSIIIHSKNKLGLRGPNLTDSNKFFTRILCVGGSTTECQYLSDNKDWPSVLSHKIDSAHPKTYWLNNAGLDGHSTFGHIMLLEKFAASIKPAYIYFLVGCNDIGRADLSNYDMSSPGASSFYIKSPIFLFEHSYIIKLLEKLRYDMFQDELRKKYKIQHETVDFSTYGKNEISPEVQNYVLHEHSIKYVPAYGLRLQKIATLCKTQNIHAIFITQPTLAGTLKDPTTGIDMNKIFFSDSLNGATYRELLELYNDETRKVALQNGIPVIDLAHEMPKDSKYYYDFIHYTNSGAAIVSQIVFNETESRKLISPSPILR